MRRTFGELGLEPVDVPLEPAALERHPAGAPFSWDVDGKANVVATWAPEAPGRSLILNGHIDVVSPEPTVLWTGEPFAPRRDGDWVYGRGAGDMKSGLVAMVGAVRALQRLSVRPGGRVQLQSVVEEECTGNGALACVLAGHTADAAILTEPTKGAIWNAQVGVLWFQVRVLGAPAHAGEARGGRQRDRGVVHGDRRAARARGRAQRGQAADLRCLSAPDQPQRRDDQRRRLAVHGRRRMPHPLPARLLPGRSASPSCSAQVEQTVAGSPPPTRAHRVEVLYDGFQCEGYELPPDSPLITGLADAACVEAATLTVSSPRCTSIASAGRASTRPAKRRWCGVMRGSMSASLLRPAPVQPGRL